ncbi:hypothetical protein EDB82DRAFT_573157 [Fusarium venenatum]|uniref:uncharacterized protein n=1 Tax=Fusarium venenatum TaxID=56646 RepID=UPI001DC49E1E|nr:hypothetical protein EDB82DRAFT_573157 [Fusarium venenatum]
MSFGYGVGDFIAVLGLFERIALELRNYKDAPMHFQQLRAELDLVHSTLKHVLSLEPDCKEEFQSLEQIRAIVMHCSQPLQTMVNKMRSKESSLGHFRSTRSLSGIGERLHWSMIAQGDVDAVRKTILSQMAAVNILLSVQQLTRVKQLSLQSKSIGDSQLTIIEKHANAIAGHTSNILNIVSRTQAAVKTLTVNAAIQADIQSRDSNSISQSVTAIEKNILHLKRKTEKASAIVRCHAAFVTRHAKMLYSLMKDIKKLFTFLTKCTKDMLEAIGRNTRMLLDISGQLKQIIRAIEAIPLHLTLDIVRLDDAHGESWALPFQACRTWDSFCDLLRCVVYANERPGLNHIMHNLFTITHSKTGLQINPDVWENAVKSGCHVEQAMLIKRAHPQGTCMDPKCTGRLLKPKSRYDIRNSCTTCGRWVMASPDIPPLVILYQKYSSTTASGNDSKFPNANKTNSEDDGNGIEIAMKAVCHLGAAVTSDSCNAEYWYLLGRAYMLLEEDEKVFKCLRQAVFIQPNCASFWHSFGILFFATGRYKESDQVLTHALRLNPRIYTTWYNLGVLFDSIGRYGIGTDVFQAFDNHVPWWPGVRERLEAYQAYVQDSNEKLFRNHLLHYMMDTGLPYQPQGEVDNYSTGHGTGV